MKRKVSAIVIVVIALVVVVCATPFAALAATTTLSPASYTNTSGSTGGQPVTALYTIDLSGTQDNWDKYIEFNGQYAGYRTYTVPTSVNLATLTGMQVKVNYRGPAKSYQTWTWRLYDWTTSSYVTIGDNAAASDWVWTIMAFNATGTLSNYVNASRQLRVEVRSNNAADNMDLDYEAVILTTSDGAPTATLTPMNTLLPTSTPVPPTATRTPTSGPGSWWKPAVKSPWHWQLDDPVDFNNIHPVVFYDIDLFNNPATDVAHLHSLGIKVICYFSAGSYENGRPDSGQFTATDKGRKMQGWPEYWLDTRSANVRTIMTNRIQLCKDKGFDGVEPDNIDGYSNNTGFPLTYATQLNYNRFLATTSHNLGLAVLLKNDGDQAVDLWQYFDGELNEECFKYNECDVLHTYFVNNNKPVFHVEYGTALSTFCPTTADQLHFNSLRKPGTTVDMTFDPCPYNG